MSAHNQKTWSTYEVAGGNPLLEEALEAAKAHDQKNTVPQSAAASK